MADFLPLKRWVGGLWVSARTVALPMVMPDLRDCARILHRHCVHSALFSVIQRYYIYNSVFI